MTFVITKQSTVTLSALQLRPISDRNLLQACVVHAWIGSKTTPNIIYLYTEHNTLLMD